MKLTPIVYSGINYGWTLEIFGLHIKRETNKRYQYSNLDRSWEFGIRTIKGKSFGHLGTGPRMLIQFFQKPSMRGKPWKLRVAFGPGAGYIGGSEFSIGRMCKGREGVQMYQQIPWQIVFTRNANKTPILPA